MARRQGGLFDGLRRGPDGLPWRRVVLLAGLGLCMIAPGTGAADSYWVCGDGAWTDGSCWSATDGGAGGAGVPTSGSVYVTSSDAQDRVVSLAAGTDPVLSVLRLDGTGSGTPTVQNDGGMVRAISLFIGDAGTGSYTQTAGEIVGVNNFTLGSQAGSTGYFDLQGGAVISNQNIIVGGSGSGSFTHSGGTATAVSNLGSRLTIGLGGTYELSGTGAVNVSNTSVGGGGGGLFRQWGGDHDITRSLTLGRSSGDIGTYELHGGTLTVGQVEYMGWYGDGNFIQHGGTHNVLELYLGFDTSSFGSPPPGIATYELHGGTLHASIEQVGVRGRSTFTQTGGEHIVDNELYIGTNRAVGLEATYDLLNGTLVADEEVVGGYFDPRGTFNQFGGTNTTRVMTFKASNAAWDLYRASGDDSGFGTYNLYGGVLNLTGFVSGQSYGVMNVDGGALILGSDAHVISGLARFNIGMGAGRSGSFTLQAGQSLGSFDETIGGAGNGIFTQAGGSNALFNELVIAAEPGSSGTYNLQGGTLSAFRVRNNGTFNYTGGELTTVSGFVNGQAQPGDVLDANALFNVENTTVTVTGNVVNYGTIMVTNADLTFATGTVVSSDGAIITDPSTLRFDTLEIGAGGYLVAAPGDAFVFSGDFLNHSERGDLWDTAQAILTFSGAGDHEFHLAGGADPTSFGWGTLALGDGAALTLSGNVATGLLVASLVLGDGAILDLNGADLLVHEVINMGGSYTGGNVVVVPQVPLPPAWILLPGALALVATRRRHIAGQ